LTTVNSAVLAAIARASEPTAAVVTTGLLRSIRRPKRDALLAVKPQLIVKIAIDLATAKDVRETREPGHSVDRLIR
jgi:hypothetical protein